MALVTLRTIWKSSYQKSESSAHLSGNGVIMQHMKERHQMGRTNISMAVITVNSHMMEISVWTDLFIQTAARILDCTSGKMQFAR